MDPAPPTKPKKQFWIYPKVHLAFWFFVTIWLLILTPWMYEHLPEWLTQHSPYHTNSVQAPLSTIVLRYDGMGDGHYGASRGGGRRRHKGIDILGELNAPVLASQSGRVSLTEDSGGYGNVVIIQHGNGFESRYAHLNQIQTHVGDWIWQGQQIGLLGKTGNADHRIILPHVHYEIRKDSQEVDPMAYLDPQILPTNNQKSKEMTSTPS